MFTARYGLVPYIKHITFGLYIDVVASVYSAVRTDSLYKADYVWYLNSRGTALSVYIGILCIF